MSEAKRYYFPYYPGDWQRDSNLSTCSIGARGLWLELMNVMHAGTPYGHLSIEPGVPMADKAAAAATKVALKEYRRLLTELEKNRVFSRTATGVIYSRRMVRDEQTRQRRSEGGTLSTAGPTGTGGGKTGELHSFLLERFGGCLACGATDGLGLFRIVPGRHHGVYSPGNVLLLCPQDRSIFASGQLLLTSILERLDVTSPADLFEGFNSPHFTAKSSNAKRKHSTAAEAGDTSEGIGKGMGKGIERDTPKGMGKGVTSEYPLQFAVAVASAVKEKEEPPTPPSGAGNSEPPSSLSLRLERREQQRPAPGDEDAHANAADIATVLEHPMLDETRGKLTHLQRSAAERQERHRLAAGVVFEYFRSKLGLQNAMYSPEREALICGALEQNRGNVSELCYAVDGLAVSTWHRSKGQQTLRVLLKDRDQIERFASLQTGYREGHEHPYLETLQQEVQDKLLGVSEQKSTTQDAPVAVIEVPHQEAIGV